MSYQVWRLSIWGSRYPVRDCRTLTGARLSAWWRSGLGTPHWVVVSRRRMWA